MIDYSSMKEKLLRIGSKEQNEMIASHNTSHIALHFWWGSNSRKKFNNYGDSKQGMMYDRSHVQFVLALQVLPTIGSSLHSGQLH